MSPEDIAVELKRFDAPEEVRTFAKGRLELVRFGSLVLGRASYEPGWKWSLHVGKEGFLVHVPPVPHGCGTLREEAMSDHTCGDLP